MADLLADCDLLCVQEHWHLQEDIHLLASSPDILVAGVSGMDSSVLLQGRPYGGCAFLYKRSWNCSLQMLNVDSKRICACVIKLHSNVKLLVINAYMPIDTPANIDEFQCILYDVESIIASQCDADVVVLCGDLNTDLTRHGSMHTRALTDFISRMPLSLGLTNHAADVNYSYINHATGSKSLI